MTERLYERDAYLKEADARVVAVGEVGIELDRTVFYARGGGQPGDSGVLVTAGGEEIPIVDTVKGEGMTLLHLPADGAADLGSPAGEDVAEPDVLVPFERLEDDVERTVAERHEDAEEQNAVQPPGAPRPLRLQIDHHVEPPPAAV